jgi:DNA-directed RNA polymerase specialized sigma24 family protein
MSGIHGLSPSAAEAGLSRRVRKKITVQGGGCDPDLWLYRERTLGMLRRYQSMSVEVGRLPSLLGREFFRSRVTSYRAGTFEDSVIFVHDVANGLAQLGGFERELIAKIALQDYTQNETARLLGCWRRTVGRRFPEALDRLTEIFLQAGLLIRLPATDVARANTCQEGRIEKLPASASV